MKWLVALVLPLIVTLAQAQPAVQTDLALNYLAQTGAHPETQPLVVFLHGYGGNEEDLFELRRQLYPEFSYVSARAPMPLGESRYQWFSKTPVEGPYEGVSADIERSLAQLRTFITQLGEKYHVPPKRIYLVGFSQGAMMSYEVALRTPLAVGGIALLSGKLPAPLLTQFPDLGGLHGLPVFLGHGTADPVLTYQEAMQAREVLLSAGVTLAFHAYPGMGHGVSQPETLDLARWLLAVTGRSGKESPTLQ